MAMHRFWIVREAWRTAEQIYELLAADTFIDLDEQHRILDARSSLRRKEPLAYFGNPFLPRDFLRPRINLPEHDFAPDYFDVGPVTLVSHRLRSVLAQPETVIQYHPIELVRGGPAVRAQDYRWMNILACHPAIDRAKSIFETDQLVNYKTGERTPFIRDYTRMVFRDDIDPGAEIFRVAEDLVTVLATDALAERVMRAGCTGIAFEDPETFCARGPIHRYRAATGIVEEDMEKILPPIR